MSLLIVHPRTTDPAPFLRALPVHNSTWEINNKYYTARVNVLVHPLDDPPRGQAEAVIYLFDSDPTPPEELHHHLHSTDPELRFAIRLPSPARDTNPHDPETEEDAWDVHGVEYVDLSRLRDSEDADGPMQGVRDSLQTILWPGMTRKPLASQSDAPRPNGLSAGEPPTRQAPIEAGLTPFEMTAEEETAFLHREQEKLDAWLDTDDVAFPTPQPTPGGFDDDFLPPGFPLKATDADADEFGTFQSASSLPRRKTSDLNSEDGEEDDDDDDDDDDPVFPSQIDPTHLLTHLQSLRNELSAVPDDLRRVRAAREVERLFSGFGAGFEGLDLQDLEGKS